MELMKGRKDRSGIPIEIGLKQYFPSGNEDSAKSIINYLECDRHTSSREVIKGEVCFVDLSSSTAGDDWGFVHRLLSTLQEPGESDPGHLVVLDAVEGFETLVGDLNAFGEKSSRRSRIAQVMRLAAGKCHLLLVVEEGREQRFPEEFVTDVVIRLRNVETGRYLRRTVEIEKARGQWHRRGQHPYVIRDGIGSTTGEQENADDPKVGRDDHPKQPQSYVHVFPSLDYSSRELMIDKGSPLKAARSEERFAAFGIPFLDNMLGGSEAKATRNDTEDHDTRGLRCGSATVLLGDSLTQKSQLGKAFLSRAFYSYTKELRKNIASQKPAGKKEVHELAQLVSKRLAGSNPVTLLFTTQDLNNASLGDEFYQRLRGDEDIFGGGFKSKRIAKAFEAEVKDFIEQHSICRRFEIHDLPAPLLMSIFQRSIERAQRIVLGIKASDELPQISERFQASWRIRVVIDDLNSFRNTYPEVRDDPLLLPSLLFMLRREGVTSLIIETQSSGRLELSITERFDSSVRNLVQTQIYAWRLPFYGEHRVAISVIPPISHDRGLIRELHWETKNDSGTDGQLTVDPHFELYMGLEKAQPRPVPLEVRMYSDTPSVEKYIATEEKLLREIFTPVSRNGDETRVIIPSSVIEYEALRDACHLQRDTKLDHTTILQVNEFWWLRRPKQRRGGAFRSQWNYLNSVTATLKGGEYCSEPVVDPFWVFQPPPVSKQPVTQNQDGSEKTEKRPKSAKVRRSDFFDEACGYDLEIKEGKGVRGEQRKEAEQSVDRVPYTWDFGFLLCNGYAWEEAVKSDIGGVKDVWDTCTAERNQEANTKDSNSARVVSWRKFLGASKLVAEFQSYRASAPAIAFDFTMLIPESFSCLVLEMWFSEAYDSLEKYEEIAGDNASLRKTFADGKERLEGVGQRKWHLVTENPVTLLSGIKGKRGETLKDILKAREKKKVHSFSLELYKVWLLLTESIDFGELVDSSSHLNFEFKSRDVGPQAVSARHWYKTASKFMDSLRPEQLEYNWIPVRLPGHFSVRADWFLAVASGSRSSRLADHALDLLSSQRSNVTRLQEGIGLPTRKLFDEDTAHLRTRLISARKGMPLENVEYDSLRRIGAPSNATDEKFYWLWRSGMWAYNRHSRIWHKWLNRALLWWNSRHQRYGSDWKNGFGVYDLLNEIEFGNKKGSLEAYEELNKLDSWKYFHELRDILIAELEQVSVSAV